MAFMQFTIFGVKKVYKITSNNTINNKITIYRTYTALKWSLVIISDLEVFYFGIVS